VTGGEREVVCDGQRRRKRRRRRRRRRRGKERKVSESFLTSPATIFSDVRLTLFPCFRFSLSLSAEDYEIYMLDCRFNKTNSAEFSSSFGSACTYTPQTKYV
jgi:hypothetical protein